MGREPVARAASGTKSTGEVALAAPGTWVAGTAGQRRERYAATVAHPGGVHGEATVCEAPLPVGRVAARKH